MKTSSAKAKGRRCAQRVKDMMRKATISTALGEDDIVVTSSGCTGEDLTLSPIARSVYPLTIECKNVEKLNIWKAIEQAREHKGKGEPAVFFTKNKEKMMVAIDAEFFLNICQNYFDGMEEDDE